MPLPPERMEEVRLRAKYACEYCGVTETDSAGQLTWAIINRDPKAGRMIQTIFSTAAIAAISTRRHTGLRGQAIPRCGTPSKNQGRITC
jgi:hypothetical protein